jgi:hypothetical protein
MSNQTSEAFAYIERAYKDAKGRVELQRRVVEQLHMVEAVTPAKRKRLSTHCWAMKRQSCASRITCENG